MYTKIDENTLGVAEVKEVNIFALKQKREEYRKIKENAQIEIDKLNLILLEAKKVGISVDEK